MKPVIQHFLLVFDHARDHLLVERSYGDDIDAATAAYADMERKYRDNNLIDIVLVGSDSLATVRVTHSTYFEGSNRRLIDAALDRALQGN